MAVAGGVVWGGADGTDTRRMGWCPAPKRGGGVCVCGQASQERLIPAVPLTTVGRTAKAVVPLLGGTAPAAVAAGAPPRKKGAAAADAVSQKKNTVAAGETRPAHGAAGGGGHRRVAPPTPAPAARGRVRPTRRQPARPALAAPLTGHPALPRELPFFVSHPARCQESLVLDARGGAQATAGGARRARTGLMLSTEEQDSTAVCASCTSAYALARQRCQRRGSQRGGGGEQHAAPAARPWPWRGYGRPYSSRRRDCTMEANCPRTIPVIVIYWACVLYSTRYRTVRTFQNP